MCLFSGLCPFTQIDFLESSAKYQKHEKNEKYSGELDRFQPTCVQSHPIVSFAVRKNSGFLLIIFIFKR